MSQQRVPKAAVRARMGVTGESYQQAAIALRQQVPDAWLQPPDDGDCAGKCASQFLANYDGHYDGGSMVDCAFCPNAICVECGRAPVPQHFERCPRCEAAIVEAELVIKLAEHCAGRRCISIDREAWECEDHRDRADSASFTCASCFETLCACGDRPMDYCGVGCRCHAAGGDSWDEEWERQRIKPVLVYEAGAIVRAGGGTLRQVFGRLAGLMGTRLDEATYEELWEGVQAARAWKRELLHARRADTMT